MDQRIENLINLLTGAVGSNQESQKQFDQFKSTLEKAKTIDEVLKLLKAFTDSFTRLAKTQDESLASALKLAQEIGKDTPGPGPTTNSNRPDDIARQFRTLIETSQREARTPGTGESAATIKSLDVELKGLIVVENSVAGIVPPHPDRPIDAGQLSTIRMSFGSIPLLKTSQDTQSK